MLYMSADNPLISQSKDFYNSQEATICMLEAPKELKSYCSFLLESIKIQEARFSLLYKNMFNFSDIYIKNDTLQQRYVKDVMIMTDRNYLELLENMGESPEAYKLPKHLWRDDNGKFLDIHNFDGTKNNWG